MDTYHQWLDHCRQLAERAAANGNPPVGAVVVRNGTIIGRGEEAGKSSGDITRHAEIEAVRDAVRRSGSADLSDCVLISTHEPCVMCAYVIRYHQLRVVAYAQPVPAVGGINSVCPVLTAPDFWAKKPAPEVIRLEDNHPS